MFFSALVNEHGKPRQNCIGRAQSWNAARAAQLKYQFFISFNSWGGPKKQQKFEYID